MAAGLAARIGDQTNHGGAVVGTGVLSVMIDGKPAAVADPKMSESAHACPINPPANPHAMTPFPSGSTSVSIGGLPALRMGDSATCGAMIVSGAGSLTIGG
jgi:uncharacterized Zn-binding protein involved in type VI secretion